MKLRTRFDRLSPPARFFLPLFGIWLAFWACIIGGIALGAALR